MNILSKMDNCTKIFYNSSTQALNDTFVQSKISGKISAKKRLIKKKKHEK